MLGQARPLRLVLIADGLLALLFLALLTVAWRTLPADGVKLHGNIDTGVDLLGRRVELLWVAVAAALIVLGNGGLAAWLRTRQPAAAAFLLGSTVPLLIGFVGVLLFVLSLNRPG